MNRNYPVEWRPEGDQAGAGPYPTSEPEIRAVVAGDRRAPNICAFIQYHTYSGVHLRPYGTKADDQIPTVDLRVFKEIGDKATELTGYPAVSVWHNFKYDPKDVITGVADDWAYDHLGVHAWTTEFWNPMAAAGIDVDKKSARVVDRPPARRRPQDPGVGRRAPCRARATSSGTPTTTRNSDPSSWADGTRR